MERTLEKLAGGEHVTIVALGDSTTEITFYTQGHMNWLQYLEEALIETYGIGCCTVINVGRGGDTFGSVGNRLDRDVIRFSPDLVVVSLGINDALGKLQRLPVFKEEVKAVVHAIRARCGSEILIRTPNPVVTVRGMPPPPEQPEAGRVWEAPDRPVGEYARALAAVARELECPVVDHYRMWEEAVFRKTRNPDPPGLWPRMGDAVHPGPMGHVAFFREIAPCFEVPTHFPWEEGLSEQ
ncbi:MAG: SGNH/GDSL hydrolase family protein [Desulfatibacillaceae bacterium]